MASAFRGAGPPGIGAYWLCPSRMKRATASTSSGAQSKSGNPWERLMALCSSASLDIVAKMLTPVLGSLDRRGVREFSISKLKPRSTRNTKDHSSFANVVVDPSLLYQLMRLERHEGVLEAKFNDAIDVALLRDLTAAQPIPQPAQLVAVQVTHEFVHKLRRRRRSRPDAMLLELLEHLAPVAVFHRGRRALCSIVAHADATRSTTASEISVP